MKALSKIARLHAQIVSLLALAEAHIKAISSAHKGMMDLALGVAVGSSTQIALFVVPCAVIWDLD